MDRQAEAMASVETERRAYGKINLSLDVMGLRADGFHEVETVMQRISLYDQVQLRWVPDRCREGIAINVETNKSFLPVDARNLAYQAAQQMVDRFGGRVGGGEVYISIKKRIPVAAGLAGGSSDSAAVLIGLNQLWGLGQSTKRLCRLGEALGSDVPFCVLTQNTRFRAALGKGRGEKLTPLRKPLRKYVVLAKPAFGISTREAFRCIDEYTITQRPDNEALIEGLKAQDDKRIYANMINVLETYALAQYEAVGRLKEIFVQALQAEQVLMTGSGPTVFGLYPEEKKARKAAEALRGMRYEAYWASTMER